MGAWGYKLYQNDTTSDVKDSYMGLLKKGKTNVEAYETTLQDNREYIGDQDEPLFWYALADTQWNMGRLMPEVRDKALMWIERLGGIELWDEVGKGDKWRQTLSELKTKLESPQPPEKKIRKRRIVNQNLWNMWDVYAYRFHGEYPEQHGMKDKYILMRKVDPRPGCDDENPAMVVQIIDHLFDEIPAIDDVDKYRRLPLWPCSGIKARPTWSIPMRCLLDLWNEKDYPKEHLIYIGNKETNNDDSNNTMQLCWMNIDNWLCDMYLGWQGEEYYLDKDGFYYLKL